MHPTLRLSPHVNRRQAHNFIHAILFARAQGRPLNAFVTVNFNHTDCPPARVSEAFKTLRRNHFGPWLSYQSRRTPRHNHGPPAYVWMIEDKSGHTHVHWLVYVPARLRKAFEAKLHSWVSSVAGTVHCPASAINAKNIYGPRGLGLYLLKGMDPSVARFFHVTPKPQGIVYGKRCGISESLGPAARRRAAVHPRAA